MALTRLETPQVTRRFLTYDLEWVPGTLKLRLVGVYDGKRFRSYRSIASFLAGEMTAKNRGAWFYAHWGGIADIQFVLQELASRQDYSATGSFSGSSLIIAHVRKAHNAWHFLDSAWLFRMSLAEVGKIVGMAKGGPDKSAENAREWYASVSDTELIPYCEQDCRILWHAIDQLENTVLSKGGTLQMTLASTAMTLFRRKYLTREIPTDDSINAIARHAYVASRVEVFTRDCETAYYYDVRSSFPYAMTHTLPGAFLEAHSRLSDRLLRDDTPSLVYAKVKVPDSYISPLPMRRGGKVLFPTGVWTEWFTGIDLALLLEAGGKILSVQEALEFEPNLDAREFVRDLYESRLAAQSEGERYYLKILMNSFYGKTAERQEKSRLHLNPSAAMLRRLNYEDNYRGPGIWAETVLAPVPHVHVPIAAQVTAIARRTIYRHLVSAGEVYYCDTDGFATSDSFPESRELGGLALEKFVDRGLFVAPKVYRLVGSVSKGGKEGYHLEPGDFALGVGGDIWASKTLLKAKGFSLGQNRELAERRFSDLAGGLSIQIERMSRVRESLRKGSFSPSEKPILKRLKGEDSMEKRFFYPDGDSRPWHTSELRGLR